MEQPYNSRRVALGLIYTSFSLVLLQLLPSFPTVRTKRLSSCLAYPVGFLIHASQEVPLGKMIILWRTEQNREENSKPRGHGRCPHIGCHAEAWGEWRCLVPAVWEGSQAPFSRRPPGKVMYSQPVLVASWPRPSSPCLYLGLRNTGSWHDLWQSGGIMIHLS